MKKSVLETKGCFESGVFKVTHIKITKRIAEHGNNSHLTLSTGYMEMSADCNPACPRDTLEGFYTCVSGNCVFFPYG